MSYPPPKTPQERRTETILVKCLYREATASEEKELRSRMGEDAALRGRMEAMERTLALLGEMPASPASPQLEADVQAMARREILKERRAGAAAGSFGAADSSAAPAPETFAPGKSASGDAEPPAKPAERRRERRLRGRRSFRRTWLPILIGAAMALAIVAVIWFASFRGG